MKGMRGLMLFAALALVGSGSAYLIPAGVSAVTGTTTQTATLDVGTGDFTYDGQAVPIGSWPNMGNLAYTKWVRTPLDFTCQSGTLAVTDKTTYQQEHTTLTFTPPAGSVIVGVLVKSGSAFEFGSAAWAEDGSAATVTITQGFSGTAVFYCTRVAPVTTTVSTPTLPATTTATVSGTTTTSAATTAATTTTVKSAPLTPKKVTKTTKKAKVKAKKHKKKPKVVSHKRPKVTG
jgi:hypothetical protein